MKRFVYLSLQSWVSFSGQKIIFSRLMRVNRYNSQQKIKWCYKNWKRHKVKMPYFQQFECKMTCPCELKKGLKQVVSRILIIWSMQKHIEDEFLTFKVARKTARLRLSWQLLWLIDNFAKNSLSPRMNISTKLQWNRLAIMKWITDINPICEKFYLPDLTWAKQVISRRN